VRAVVSRVLRARVTVDGKTVGQVGPGLLVLVGVTAGDSSAEAAWLAGKVAGLRVFDDSQGRMNLALADVGGAVLVVSQFTLYGDTRAGRRPSYLDAARPEQAEPLVEEVVKGLAGAGVPVATGRFRAHMQIESVADGPVTILLDSAVARR
jgi:D-aminoacyl-tRNA deacylase